MALIDSLLKVLRDNQGDKLVLVRGSPPRLIKGDQQLRYFFPPNDEKMHAMLVDELLNDQRRQGLERGESAKFSYSAEGLGSFDVLISGASAQRATFTSSRAPKRAVAAAAPVAAPAPAPAPLAPTAPLALPQAAMPEVPGQLLPALGTLLETALELGASDLHLATGEPPTVRIDGRLSVLQPDEVDVDGLVSTMLPSSLRQRVAAGDSADLSVQSPTGARFRVNAYRHDGGWAAAFRVLRRQAPSLSRLGLPPQLAQVTDLEHGLVLVVGPTGSGKSTTLAALAAAILRKRGGLLVTLEDPIEYDIPAPAGSLVRQREVGAHMPDFASGLRAALRQDPDLLLVGEMRDPETIQLALTAAETGHLVLSTLHSRTAVSAVDRILDSLPAQRQAQARTQLADALRFVFAQRLVPGVRGGRVPAVEVLRNTHAVAAMIRDGKSQQLPNALQMGAREGMVPMSRALDELVALGRIRADQT